MSIEVGKTFNGCPVVIAEDGQTYAIDENSWNGEAYCYCWRVYKDGTFWDWEAATTTVVLRPVERWQDEGIDLDEIEENSADWNHACERVRYEIGY